MLLDNRKFLELLFDDTFTYTAKENYKDPTTKRTYQRDVTYPLSGEPYKGRVSYQTVRPTETNGLTEVEQSVKLFTYPEITIPAGSKITITRNGVATVYKHSGKPAVYSAHQEIPIELWRDKA